MHIPIGFSQVNYRFSGPGLPNGAEVAFGIKNTPQSSPNVIIETAGGAFNGFLRSSCSDKVTLSGILVKNGPNDVGPAALTGFASTGTNNVGDVIPSVSLLVRKNTNLGGRRGRGRGYWPVIGETQIEAGGALNTPALTALQTSFDSWFDFFETEQYPLVLLHGDDVGVPVTLTSLSVQAVVATQRRRLRR